MPKRPKQTTRGKQAKAKQRTRAAPLTVEREAVRSRRAGKKPAHPADAARPGKPEPDTTLFGQDALEAAAFTTRCASAYSILPLRLARCGSPVELMREQAMFAFEIAGDCRAFAGRALARWLELTRGGATGLSPVHASNNSPRNASEP
jgi:hypothetical protein